MAGELVSKFMFNRPGLNAIALTSNSSIVTAIGNDFGYEHIFSRQIDALGEVGDIFIGYSTSGLSKNILKAFEIAKKNGLITIGFTGISNSPMVELCDHLIQVPSDETPRIQEGHLILGHLICEQIEKLMFGNLV
jgi:D-sedoheptulose 7-phosphate isomerase